MLLRKQEPWPPELLLSQEYGVEMMTTTILQSPALPADWRDLFALTKPRVMRSVVFTALCGMLAAPVALPPALGFAAILAIALAAGSAGALNQWYEADIDALMRRTANRPHGGDAGLAARRWRVEARAFSPVGECVSAKTETRFGPG